MTVNPCDKSLVIVVSPLISLMKDQIVIWLNAVGDDCGAVTPIPLQQLHFVFLLYGRLLPCLHSFLPDLILRDEVTFYLASTPGKDNFQCTSEFAGRPRGILGQLLSPIFRHSATQILSS